MFFVLVVVVGFLCVHFLYGVCGGHVFGVGLWFGFCLVVVVVVGEFFLHGLCMFIKI